MTFVAAKRFGRKVVVVADTMVSDLDGTQHSIIPGQLKIIVLSPAMTIAFAGLVNQSLDTIRAAKKMCADGVDIKVIQSMLQAETVERNNRVEFLLVSHIQGEPTLKRIWDGRVSDDLQQACIGERDLMSILLTKESEVPLGYRPHEFELEMKFLSAFQDLFEGVNVVDGVGGFPVMANCSPYGHCYTGCAGSMSWDEIAIPQGVTAQQEEDRRTGKTQWSFNVQDTKYRGVALLGAIIPDSGVGYVYSPLESDEPRKWNFARPTSQGSHGNLLEQFRAVLELEAERLGGVLIDEGAPVERRLTDDELEEVTQYAAAAAIPTRVSIRGDGLWIECGEHPMTTGQLLGFIGLEPNPVAIIKTMIERMNADMSKSGHSAQ